MTRPGGCSCCSQCYDPTGKGDKVRFCCSTVRPARQPARRSNHPIGSKTPLDIAPHLLYTDVHYAPLCPTGAAALPRGRLGLLSDNSRLSLLVRPPPRQDRRPVIGAKDPRCKLRRPARPACGSPSPALGDKSAGAPRLSARRGPHPTTSNVERCALPGTEICLRCRLKAACGHPRVCAPEAKSRFLQAHLTSSVPRAYLCLPAFLRNRPPRRPTP